MKPGVWWVGAGVAAVLAVAGGAAAGSTSGGSLGFQASETLLAIALGVGEGDHRMEPEPRPAPPSSGGLFQSDPFGPNDALAGGGIFEGDRFFAA